MHTRICILRRKPGGAKGSYYCAIRAGRVSARGGRWRLGAYFGDREACAQYDPKVIVGAKTLDPKGDANFGS